MTGDDMWSDRWGDLGDGKEMVSVLWARRGTGSGNGQ